MADVQTIFGNINQVIDQVTQSAVKLKEASATYAGRTPTPDVGAYTYQLGGTKFTPTQVGGIVLLGGILLLIVVLVVREMRK